jgi:hypothetical protein
MAMTSDAVLRWVRALTLPSVLFFSGLAGHATGDGVIPAASVLVVLFVFTVAAVAPFAWTPIRPAATVALLVGGQGLLHAALQLLSGTAGTATAVMCADTGTTTVASPANCHLMTHHSSAAPDGFGMQLISGGHLVMVLGHLAAAVVAGVWLAAGERTLWMVLVIAARPVVNAWRTVAALVRGAVGALAGNYPPLQLGWVLPCALHDSTWAAGPVSRRGPPGACAA